MTCHILPALARLHRSKSARCQWPRCRHPCPRLTQSTKRAFVFEIGSPGGDAAYSAVLAGYAAGKAVTLKGSDACDISNNVETLNWIRLE